MLLQRVTAQFSASLVYYKVWAEKCGSWNCLDDQIGIDAEDSVSLVLVFNKPLCERWGQLNGPPLVAWQLIPATRWC